MVELFIKIKTFKMKKILKQNYLGIDVSKPWFDASLPVVTDHVKQLKTTERFDNTVALKIPHFKGSVRHFYLTHLAP
jgi:hypothetical protein